MSNYIEYSSINTILNGGSQFWLVNSHLEEVFRVRLKVDKRWIYYWDGVDKTHNERKFDLHAKIASREIIPWRKLIANNRRSGTGVET